MRLTPTARRRPAFTLVEMMVSTALIIFMMYILANAFEKGLGAFRVLKTASDMQDKLRGAATIIRQDLAQQHFEDGGKYLGDQRLDTPDWKPPKKGYFRVYLEGMGVAEGKDPDDPGGTLFHYRSPAPGTLGHVLQFTVRLEGVRQDQFFTVNTPDAVLPALSVPTYTRSPGSTRFSTVWAEITYFVRPTGQTTDGTVPLYTLYRRQNLLLPDVPPSGLPNPSAGGYEEVSHYGNQFNGPEEVTAPARRFGGLATSAAAPFTAATLVPLSGAQTASDQLLTNVLNWEVKMLWDPSDVIGERPQAKINPDFPFDHPSRIPAINPAIPGGTKVFDTWSSRQTVNAAATDDFANDAWKQGYSAYGSGAATPKTLPMKVRVRALQIELRIWDPKSKTTRQMTIIQDV
jgi:hypothetical protein